MVVTRRNILSDSNVRGKYIEGVKLLKQDFLKPDWTNTYDVFVIWHYHAMMEPTPPGSDRNAAHQGPSFLPWHRWFLILLEHHLQRVLDDPNFGLPYWDWADDGELPPDQQHRAPIWAHDCMGGSGSRVTTGPFREGQWQVNIESRGYPNAILVPTNRPLRRAFRRGANSLPTKEDVRRAIIRGEPSTLIYDARPWDRNSESFRNELEGWWPDAPGMHNLVHVWVGGDMGPASSPNDPVFFLNHCNVDRIWENWKQRHGNPTYLPDNNAGTEFRGHRLNDRLFPATEAETKKQRKGNLFDPIYRGRVRPVDLLDVSARYVYDTF
jgi:tyrosinase